MFHFGPSVNDHEHGYMDHSQVLLYLAHCITDSSLVYYINRRASYFSSNPTDKMYAVVAAAKALYDQLGVMREMSIDGDSFLDLWVYVILKANMKDLVRAYAQL